MVAYPPQFLSNQSELSPIERFLEIFPCRWNWIYKENFADHWKTESKYPISNADLLELWFDPIALVGVRFDKLTQYGLIDIDVSSPYHPNQDRQAISAIRGVLENVGFCRTIAVQSSDSSGIHLYIPLDSEIKTFTLAQTLRETLEQSGYTIAPGILEIFPNTKTYNTERYTSYNGHRLPLQQGSYFLDDDLEIISDNIEDFIAAFETAARANDLEQFLNVAEKLKQRKAKRKAKLKRFKFGSSGDAWKESLERAISIGWTGYKQTNKLIGAVAEYGRVFLAIECRKELTQYCLKIVQAMPGYEKFCRHKADIVDRCSAWAKSAIRSRTPYCSIPDQPTPWRKRDRKLSDHNKKQIDHAAARIREAIANLSTNISQTALSTTEKLRAIAKAARCSLATLYKHRSLWLDALGCNSQKSSPEAISEPTEETIESQTESLKSKPRKRLHPKNHYKGFQLQIPVSDAKIQAPDSDQTLSLAPRDTRRAANCDRATPSAGERVPIDGSSG